MLPGIGVSLVHALVDAARGLPEAVEGEEWDEYEFTLARLMRTSGLLLTLEKPLVDLLLLKPDSQGRTALAEAAAQPDTTIFYALYQALSGQCLVVKPQLQRRLETASSSASAALPPRRRAAQHLAERLGTRATDLSIQHQPGGGLTVQLFPETGVQPSAQQAQELFGNGTMAAFTVRPKELDRWSEANSVCRVYNDVACCRRTRDKLAADREIVRQALNEDEAAQADLAAAVNEVARCADWVAAAAKEVKEAQEWELKTMRDNREAMLNGASDEECEEAKRLDDEAQVRHTHAKQDVTDSKDAAVAAAAWKERASAAAPPFTTALEAARVIEREAELEATTAVTCYKATMQGPVRPKALG